MPKYFFDTNDGDEIFCDSQGIVLDDDVAARLAVLDALPDMAREKMPDGDHRTFTSTARDEAGRVVYEAKMVLKGGWNASKG